MQNTLLNFVKKYQKERDKLKKIFKLREGDKHPDRIIEKIKHQLRKYLKREKKKKIQVTNSFYDFNCRFGKDKESSKEVSFNEIIQLLDKTREDDWRECYIEIVAVIREKSLQEQDTE